MLRWLWRAGALAGIALLIYRRLWRLRPLALSRTSHPARDYGTVLARLHTIHSAENDTIEPVCRTQLLTHGRQTAQVIVLLHGYTNCPHQFHQLAPRFFALGYNVLVARLPRHGLADPLTQALAHLTAEELADATTELVDIARGLGEKVTVFGFSLGAVLAGWVAQHRADVAQVVLAAPALALQAVPARRSRWMANLLALAPNFYRWWDPQLKDKRDGPQHAYPRFASHGLAAMLRLGCIVQDEAKRSKPLTPSLIVIVNPTDPVVDNCAVSRVVDAWRAHGASVQTHVLPAEWHLIHDWMDPDQVEQQVARVYPQVVNWVTG